MATVSSTSNFWIKKNALNIMRNALGNPDYVQVSVSSGAVILAYIEGIIDYDAAHNYRRWAIEAYPTVFSSEAAQYVYARLDKMEPEYNLPRALIVYSTDPLDLYGRKSEEDPVSEYFYIYLGRLSSSLSPTGKSQFREWEENLINEGRLSTDEQNKEDTMSGWKKIFSLDEIRQGIIPHFPFLFAYVQRLFIGLSKKAIIDVKRSVDLDVDVPINDTNVTTSKYVEDNFISKKHNDKVRGQLSFERDTHWGKFQQGVSGAAIREKEGNWHVETDFLHVRKKISAQEVTIEETNHIGGAQLLSAAESRIAKVEELADTYRCYFYCKDGNGVEIRNKWVVNDQAFTNTFNVEKQADGTLGNHYLWRLVVAVGTGGVSEAFGDMSDYHWIDLSKDIKDSNSEAPKVGDCLVQLGNQQEGSDRTSAIYIVGAGMDSPYIRLFQGITSFSLPQPETQLMPGDNRFKGRVNVTGGTGAANFDDLPEAVANAVKIGGENLLRNTGFDGEYESKDFQEHALESLDGDSELYNAKMDLWIGDGISEVYVPSKSGRACRLGRITQQVDLIIGESYVMTFKSDGAIALAVNNIPIEVSTRSQEEGTLLSTVRFVASSAINKISFSGSSQLLWEVKLERGNVPTDWCPHLSDVDPVADRFRADAYLRSALQEGSTDILGGLILTSLIHLGNYEDGKMKEVTAGASGIFNNRDDVAIWGGGSLEMAMNTVAKYRKDPLYVPTEEELKTMAKAVITHGGRAILQDVILRGYVYAEGGVFRGTVHATDGEFKGVINSDKGHFRGFVNKGITYITPENLKDYIVYEKETMSYNFNFEELSPIVVFSGDYFDKRDIVDSLIVNLPFLDPHYPLISDAGRARSFIGTDMVFYNEAVNIGVAFGGLIHISDTDISSSSHLLSNESMCHVTCKLRFTKINEGDLIGTEEIYWLWDSGDYATH